MNALKWFNVVLKLVVVTSKAAIAGGNELDCLAAFFTALVDSTAAAGSRDQDSNFFSDAVSSCMITRSS